MSDEGGADMGTIRSGRESVLGRRRAFTVIVAVAALLVGGCTVPGDREGSPASTNATADTRPAPGWEQLRSPESPTDGRLASTVTTVLGATGASPALLVGSAGTRPAAPEATAWAFGDNGWEPAPLPDGRGLTVTASVDDGSQTWLAGWRWDLDTGVSAALLSSTDRTSWQEEPLDGVPEGAYPAALVPTDDGLVLLGRTVDEVPFSWRLGDSAEWVPLPLPDGHDGQVLAAGSLGAGTVVAVVGSSRPGAPELPSSVVSEDAGRTWRPGGVLPGEDTGVSGLAVVEDGVVATGWSRQDDRLVPASWLSTDGVTWLAEDVTGQAGLDLSSIPGVDVWLGAPTVRSEVLVAPLTVRASLESLLLERTADGWGNPAGTVPSWRSPGVSPVVAEEGEELLVVQSQSGGVRVRRSTGEDWQEWFLGEVLAAPTVTELVPSPDGAVLWTDSERLVVEPDTTWVRTYESQPHQVTAAGEVDALPWPGGPEAPDVTELAGQLSGVVMTTVTDGSTLVLGEVLFDGEQAPDTDVLGWLDSPDGSRRLVEGLEGPGAAWVRGATEVGGAWFAVGGSRPDLDATSTASAQAWRSDDGVTWAPLTGDYLGDDETESVAEDVCAGPDGQVLAVGVADVDGSERAVVWRLDGEGAVRVWTSAAGEDAVIDGCVEATERGATLLTGEVAGEPTAWSTIDGSSFDAVPLGSLGSTFGRVRSVPGGFAAAGQMTEGDDAWTGGVVHLSVDARSWRTLRLPADVYTDAADVVAVGEDLLVAGDTDAGPQLWWLRDYANQL